MKVKAKSPTPCTEKNSNNENNLLSDGAENFFSFIDQAFQANLAKLTLGISPAALGTAYFSWLAQLSQSPGRLAELALYPALHFSDVLKRLLNEQAPAGGKDVRFQSEKWQFLPWRWWAEGFLEAEKWWQQATVDVPGVSSNIERTVSFSVRQILDALSPSNFILSNPDLFLETIHTGGENLIRGTEIAIRDTLERSFGIPPIGVEHFVPGKDVAITPGRIVYRNHLIELIQYEPTTKHVLKEPLLILPAWIMKYYILDLSPHNSMVKWLVEQGHTVFTISWRNPDNKDRDLGLEDYFCLGAMAAIDTVSKLIPKTKIHLVGYCLGGTLAIITAAAMAMNEDKRLKSLTLLAAQGDFSEAGELMFFINESEIAFLENMMWEQGYLDPKQMAGSFQMLRSYDLIWSKMVNDYMHGRERGMIDLLAWNADATRMPYKMHSEYLEKLFLNNDLAHGRFLLGGRPVVPENIRLPIFAVSTEKDHIAPWKSVYKIHLMANSDITFVLAGGGHNGGIISEPNHKGSTYRILEHDRNKPYIGPEEWFEKALVRDGSWWFAWHDWLVKQSTADSVCAPPVDKTLPLAPGSYVLQK